MHHIGYTVPDRDRPGLGPVELFECDNCGCAVSDPDLHKARTGHDTNPEK